jgi:hypothetical protein
MFSDAYVVNVRISEREDLGEAMGKWRAWLDSQKIQPAEFRTIPGTEGYAFRIGFRNADEAELFRQRFLISRQ